MSTLTLRSPLAGWVMPLEEVPDPVFAGRMLGDGLAIDPTTGVLCAPCDGVLVSVAPTRHAVTLRADNGAELLIHIGIDTVGLDGAGFEALAEAERRVELGAVLLRFDLDLIARRAPSLITPIIVTNGDRYDIVRRSAGRLLAQGEQLMELRAIEVGAAEDPDQRGADTLRLRLRVPLPHGLHARPAGLVARRAREFDARVIVTAHGRRASAASAVSLMSLGVRRDDEIGLEATGSEARAALDALATLLGGAAAKAQATRSTAAREAIAARATAASPAPGATLPGVVAACGVAIGTAAFVAQRERPVPEMGAGAAHEAAELERARAAVRARLDAAAGSAGPRAEILAAHREFLDDPDLLAAAAAEIARGKSAGYAWRSAIRRSIDVLQGLDDALLRERADDLVDLESQVLAALAGESAQTAIPLPERAIVLADELLPSQLIALDAERLAGIATARGGPTSHIAILAAAIDKPMLVALGESILGVEPGTPLWLDAERGELQIDPSRERLAAAEVDIRERRHREAAEHAAAGSPALTVDAVRIDVFANVGSAADAAAAVAAGAEGCGLLRTEFLFLDRQTPPDVTSQAREYQRVIEAFGGRPVVIRTLDAGADKPLAFLPQPHEDNPALGVRGIRVGLRYPELLAVQLEALLSVRPLAACRVLLPMVNEADEMRRVREILDALAARLGVERPALGAMIETPAAALAAAHICEVADFVSIGTNDLTQYTLAMDRTHAELAARLDGLHPAVLRLIAVSAESARARGREIAVCGGLAADPLAVPVLLGVGVQELSVVPRLIARTKARIRALTLADCRVLAQRALALDSAAAVRALLRDAERALPRQSSAVQA